MFPFEQLARLRSLPETYETPEPKAFKPRVDPSSWLADEQHRDQFVLRYSEPHPSGKLVRTRGVGMYINSFSVLIWLYINLAE